jgi:malonyl-CoA/methylmalonyl-CoA synthetase
MLSIIENAKRNGDKRAIISNGKNYTYQQLLDESESFAQLLLENQHDINESRVAFMVNPGFDYVKVQWGIWRAGGIIVPMCLTHPLPSLEYVLEDTQATILVVSPEYEEILIAYTKENNIRLIVSGCKQV